MMILAHTDGASRGNPGASGIGFILKDPAGNVLCAQSGFIGQATNNVAEYEALLACLRKVHTMSCTKLVVHSDSQLVVRQLRGEYRVKDQRLRQYVQQVRTLLANAPFTFEIIYVDREQNREADHLANAGIDGRHPVPA